MNCEEFNLNKKGFRKRDKLENKIRLRLVSIIELRASQPSTLATSQLFMITGRESVNKNVHPTTLLFCYSPLFLM